MTQKQLINEITREGILIGRGMTGAIQTDTYIPVKTVFRLLGFYCKKKGCENVVEHGLTRWCPEHRVEAYQRAQKRFKKRSNPLGLK